MKTVKAMVDGEYIDVVTELDPEEKEDYLLVDVNEDTMDLTDELENTMEFKQEEND